MIFARLIGLRSLLRRHARWALSAAAVAAMGAGSAAALTPVRVVEPPPAAYADGPTLTGKTWEMVLPDVRQVDYLCRLFMGLPPMASRPGSYHLGCYSTKLDAVVLVARQAWPSRDEWEALRRHEWAHARGWRHKPDGHGTGPTSVTRQAGPAGAPP